MKTTLIISAALLFSLASMAQTATVAQTASATSSASVRSNAVPAVEHKVAATGQRAKETIAAARPSAGVQSNSQMTIDAKNNKTSEKASINQRVMTSPVKAKAAGSQLKEESKTAVAHTTKSRPASIKANAKVKVNTAIRIK